MSSDDGQFEDGMRRATQNLDKAAEAAPPTDLVDEDDFGLKDDNTAETDSAEELPHEESDDDSEA